MRYLKKTPESRTLAADWSYPRDANKIRAELLREQRRFCAYSERFIQQTDSCDVEHFDPRLKGKAGDGYDNWYAVLHWMNSRKPKKIDPYLPILHPSSSDLRDRIRYEVGQDGEFVASRDDDIEAENLIRFLGWNRRELCNDRKKHVSRIRDLKSFHGENMQEFREYLRAHPEYMSFATAIEAELGIDVSDLI